MKQNPGLGPSYAIWPGNKVGISCSSQNPQKAHSHDTW